ncbi:HD family phosphohydrolase [Niallia sp. Krafla_26]|uniref:HD family phosphohydrolase n=1 Tax=Niallia sp. Krafla_26 TaxID=3064703 RepID=UPI003D17F63D
MHLHLAKLKNLLDITVFRVLLFLLLGLILYLSMFNNVKPEKLNADLFSVAQQTIRSPITIEDKESTEAKKKEAENGVKDVYVVNKALTQNRIDLITSIFDATIDVNEKMDGNHSPIIAGSDSTTVETDKLKNLKEQLTEDVTKELPDSVFTSLLSSSVDQLEIARDLSVTAINSVMSNRISANEVENAKKQVEEAMKYSSLASPLKNAAIELGRFAVVQNEFYDPVATKEMRRQAIESVEPIMILQGQIIVQENQLISRDIYRQLGLVGLLDNERTFQPFIGLSLLILIILAALYYYFYNLDKKPETKHNYFIMFSIIFTLSIILMKIVSMFYVFDYANIAFIFPAALAPMLIKVLIDEKLAIFTALITTICGSIMFNEGVTGTFHMTIGVYILCSGIAGIMFLRNYNNRSNILMTGLYVAFINVLVILAIVLLRNGQYNLQDYGGIGVIALISGLLSSVLTIGLVPFFEAGFGILSTMKLIELSNPNHPLLKKLLIEAPGTYHHSVMVANLAEGACEAIGANGLLARVGCYYHDLGKTKRPNFFIENQMSKDNPHDELPPETSKEIILAHTIDGVDLLKEYKMPKEIIDIAEQHHGTTLLKFFYFKAKQDDSDTTEEEYRYPGPKAQTKEAAVVGIADSVEAAVRSMSQPTHEQIENLVRKIISDRLQDEQFNECDITLKELEKVAETLCETLKGIFHSRIKYPELSKQEVKHA